MQMLTNKNKHCSMLEFCFLSTLLLILVGCGSGSDSADSPQTPEDVNPTNEQQIEPTEPVTANDPAEPPEPESPATPTSPTQLSEVGELPTSLDQTFRCDLSQQVPFTLFFQSNGQFQYSDNNGGEDSGTYQLNQSGLGMTFSSGLTARAIDYAATDGLVVGMTLLDSEGVEHACIARAHNIGDKPVEPVAFTCGRRNVTGESANTFTLYPDGSADWENVFEISFDTLFQTRLGTYILNIADGTVRLAFKELDKNELIPFIFAFNSEQVQIVEAPETGEGAGVASQSCRFI